MPATSVDNPTMSAWTYALSVDITAPPVTLKVAADDKRHRQQRKHQRSPH